MFRSYQLGLGFQLKNYTSLLVTAPWQYSSTVPLILRVCHQLRYLKLWTVRICSNFASLTETFHPRLSVQVVRRSEGFFILVLVTPLESINISYHVSCSQKMFFSATARYRKSRLRQLTVTIGLDRERSIPRPLRPSIPYRLSQSVAFILSSQGNRIPTIVSSFAPPS